MDADDFERRISRALYVAWLKEARLDETTVRGFFVHGIPAEWAEAIESTFAGAVRREEWPKVIASPKHRNELLHSSKHLATVNSMTPDHAMAISKTQRHRDKKFRAAIHAAGFTQNGLAEVLKISSASLTRYRDKRPVPKAIAEKVKALTGYDGTWPGGVVE